MQPHRLIFGALIVLTIAVFWRAANCGFVSYDDPDYVTTNPIVQQGLTAHGVQWALTTIHTGYWHPLTWLSLMVDSQLWGTGPRGYHITNVCYHALAAALLFLALRSLTGSPWRSALVAALFAVHPLRVESVAWVSERKDVLGGCLALATLLAYCSYARRPALPRYALVAALFALGLMAKPTLVTLPCLLLLVDVWPLRRVAGLELPAPTRDAGAASASLPAQDAPRRRPLTLVLEKLPLLALALAASIFTYLAQINTRAVGELKWVTTGMRLGNIPVSYVRYLVKMVWFRGLVIDYPFHTWPLWQSLAAAVLLMAITVLVLARFRRNPWLAIGWFWFGGLLVPVIGIVQSGHQAMADRYTYIPAVGLLIMLVWSLPPRLFETARGVATLAGATAAALIVLSMATWHQIGYWRDSAALYGHAISVEPNNPLTLINLGVEVLEQGQARQAEILFERALAVRPDNPMAHANLGDLLFKEGRFDPALYHLRRAAELRPDRAPPFNALGTAYWRLGQIDTAITQFQTATHVDPTFPWAFRNLGTTLALRGRYQEALDAFNSAQDLIPDDMESCLGAADAATALGRFDVALPLYDEVLRRQPNAPLPLAHRGLCRLKQGRFDAAIADLRSANQISRGDPALQKMLAQALEARDKAATPAQPAATQP